MRIAAFSPFRFIKWTVYFNYIKNEIEEGAMWLPDGSREPDFTQLETVLKKGKPDRPVLWEYFMNDRLYSLLCRDAHLPDDPLIYSYVKNIMAYRNAGYDYAFLPVPPGFSFEQIDRHKNKSVSLNNGLIKDWDSFESFPWPSLNKLDLSYLEKLPLYLTDGMKLIPDGPGGVEENVIELMGYESLCISLFEEPDLVQAVFDRVGGIICEYYRLIRQYPFVGAVISNDDWGFNTQPLISPQQMETYLYPWHRKITEIIHESGLPAILHSCGNLYPDIMETIIEDLDYDAKHSYEDSIKPVEDAYEEYNGRIAILGGLDVDYVISHSENEVYNRAMAMLERSSERGGYALGTGNSVPDYIPDRQYLAMIKAAWDFNKQ